MSDKPSIDPNLRFDSHAEIARFVAGFETGTLPCTRWNHRAHLVVGLWYVSYHPAAQATHLLRAGIQRYNQACGWLTTATGGYHETLTRFWVWALRRYRGGAEPDKDLTERLNTLLHSQYADKSFPFQFFTREWLMSWEARVSWVAPDLKPLA